MAKNKISACAKAGIKGAEKLQIIGMNKIKENPLGKTREERESCFPDGAIERVRGLKK